MKCGSLFGYMKFEVQLSPIRTLYILYIPRGISDSTYIWNQNATYACVELTVGMCVKFLTMSNLNPAYAEFKKYYYKYVYMKCGSLFGYVKFEVYLSPIRTLLYLKSESFLGQCRNDMRDVCQILTVSNLNPASVEFEIYGCLIWLFYIYIYTSKNYVLIYI